MTKPLDNARRLGYNPFKMSSPKKEANRSGRWCLYILKCEDGTLYTGITNDLARRVKQHNDGSASRYTRSRLPVKLVYHEPCRGRSMALKKEFAVKSLSRKEKENYIKKTSFATKSRRYKEGQ